MRLYKDDIFPKSDTFFRFNKGSDLLSGRHDHDFYEIFLVMNGMITHDCNNNSSPLYEREAFLVHPQDAHLLQGNTDSEILNIAFSTQLFEQIAALFGKSPARQTIQLSSETVSHIQKSIRNLTSYSDMQRSDMELKSILVLLLQKFIVLDFEEETILPYWFQQFLTKVHTVDCFTGELSAIYRLTDKTPEHLARTFRKYKNTTLTEYITHLRTNYASRLLVTTTLPITDVCFESGFQNVSYFYRCFKQDTGMSPSKYRAQNSIPI